MPSAFAIGAHPDDIEFFMAGTLALLKAAGWEIHYMNFSSGNCGSLKFPPARLIRMRCEEGRRAAALLGAHYHESLSHDLEIVYDVKLLRRLAAIIREARPSMLLTHSPADYMEDHAATCRLAVTAAFARGFPNFRTAPSRKPWEGDVTVYHAMPHGLRDPLRRRIIPGAFVNTGSVQELKRTALAAHESQQDWLDASQKMSSCVSAMDAFSREVGRMSRRFEHAEGWRRRIHYGFCAEDADPLRDALRKKYLINKKYEASLDAGL